jgi:trk system potassium uptake protein TrkH
MPQILENIHPVKMVFLGYFIYIFVGWIFLNLPFSMIQDVPALDNLFIATSAVSTTGLGTVSIADNYSFLGQLIILILIQLGGIGYMTFGSFVILSRKKSLSPERLEISKTVFSLPKNFRIDKFVRSVIGFTAVIEILGAIILYLIFKKSGAADPLWIAIFHSVSSFCTAGFSLYNNSFESYAGHFGLNLVISLLSYAGAIGFIVFVDLWRKLKGKIKNITLTSKIILHTTSWLSLFGTINIFLTEPSIQSFQPDDRIIAAFFQTMTAITTVGFNTIPMSTIAKGSMFLITILMVIGASPSGTGGGIKSTTFSAMLGVMKSNLRGDSKVMFWGNEVPLERVWTAVASLCFYITFLVFGTYLLTLTEMMNFEQVVFEAASALGTVGLSLGITAALSHLGKLIVIFLMFVGRLGPLTFGIALFLKQRVFSQTEDSDLAI